MLRRRALTLGPFLIATIAACSGGGGDGSSSAGQTRAAGSCTQLNAPQRICYQDMLPETYAEKKLEADKTAKNCPTCQEYRTDCSEALCANDSTFVARCDLTNGERMFFYYTGEKDPAMKQMAIDGFRDQICPPSRGTHSTTF